MSAVAVALMLTFMWLSSPVQGGGFDADARVDFAGYSGCIELRNQNTRVVLDPNCGGRVLEYSLNGVDAIMLDPKQDGWTYQKGKRIDPCGGRLDKLISRSSFQLKGTGWYITDYKNKGKGRKEESKKASTSASSSKTDESK